MQPNLIYPASCIVIRLHGFDLKEPFKHREDATDPGQGERWGAEARAVGRDQIFWDEPREREHLGHSNADLKPLEGSGETPKTPVAGCC